MQQVDVMSEGNPESSEALIQYLEQASGRKIRSREDVHKFLSELSAQNPEATPVARLLRSLKQGTWLALLAAAYLQYYFLTVMNEIETMPEIRVNLPMLQNQGKLPPPRI